MLSNKYNWSSWESLQKAVPLGLFKSFGCRLQQDPKSRDRRSCQGFPRIPHPYPQLQQRHPSNPPRQSRSTKLVEFRLVLLAKTTITFRTIITIFPETSTAISTTTLTSLTPSNVMSHPQPLCQDSGPTLTLLTTSLPPFHRPQPLQKFSTTRGTATNLLTRWISKVEGS